jgi:conjugal transfer/entry exclusion protein
MSLKSNLFNGKIPAIFNPKNFIVTNLLDDIVSNNIVSQQVQAPIIQRVAENGDTDDFITESELDTELNNLKSLLLGSDALNNSLNSIVEINNAINNDPNFYTTITTNIATKANQSALNTTNSNVDALDTRLDTAESTISSHTSTLSSHTSTLSSHTTSINDLNLKQMQCHIIQELIH